MADEPQQAWEAATWQGSRRAQLRRALRYSPRQRLEAMVALTDTAAQLGAGERVHGDSSASRVHEPLAGYAHDGARAVQLPGCAPVPLARYLKALGVLRLIGEQADPDARGYWANEQFVLASALDADGLRAFFLERYAPTPVLAPWNGGSGFYPKDNKTGIEALAATGASRFRALRDTIALMQERVSAHGLSERPQGQTKTRLLADLRAQLPDEALDWLDAAVVLTEEDPKYPPMLGTGGNDGRLDFTNNFLQRLVAVFEPATGEPRALAVDWLDEALFAGAHPALPSAKVGQFAPGEAGGPNQVSGFEADKPRVNPWDFILMLEGALLFAAAATKRLESNAPRMAAYPFTVATTGAGAGAAAPADEDDARAELWAPLWSAPVGLAELRALLAEGRVTLGRRAVRDGLDFARAVSRLGIDRGISAFQRYAFLMRSGKAYFATPLNRVTVERNPAADLIDELDGPGSQNWLSRFRRFARRDGANRVLSLGRRLDDALFALSAGREDPAPQVRRVLAVLGEITLYLARSPTAREHCPPVPRLSREWLVRGGDDGTPEAALATALSSIHARDRDGRAIYPLRTHLAPEVPGSTPRWAAGDTSGHEVVWHAGSSAARNLARTLHRRMLRAQQQQWPDKPWIGSRPAPLGDVAAWLAGSVDEQRLRALLPGLMLVDVARAPTQPIERELPLPAAYRWLKPLFCPDEQLRRVGLLDAGQSLPIATGVVRRLETDHVCASLELARRTLRPFGLAPAVSSPHPGTGNGPRLLAALMVPVSDAALEHMVPRTPGNNESTAIP